MKMKKACAKQSCKIFQNSFLIYISLCLCALSLSSCKVVETKNPLPPLSDVQMRILNKMGGELLPDGNIKIENITILRREKEISFPSKINIVDSEYGVEVLIALENGRLHEALLVTNIEPLTLQLALYLLGAENGTRSEGGENLPQGTLMNIDVQPSGGERVPVEKWLMDKSTSKEMERSGWVFVGSSFTHDMICLAKVEGNIVNVWSFGNTILDNPSESGDIKHIIVANDKTTPEIGTPVIVYFSFAKKEDKK